MKVIWTARSQADLDTIAEYISQDDPSSALKLTSELVDRTEKILSDHPNAGRQGRAKDTREWTAHKSYVVAYRVRSNQIEILSVMHSARLWPDEL